MWPEQVVYVLRNSHTHTYTCNKKNLKAMNLRENTGIGALEGQEGGKEKEKTV